MTFSRTGNVSIFLVTRGRTRSVSAACSATAHCTLWGRSAGAASGIRTRASRTAPDASDPIGGRTTGQSVKKWGKSWNSQKGRKTLDFSGTCWYNIPVVKATNMETYRSGHNGADSKSVCGPPHVGSNPTRSAIKQITIHLLF